MFSQKSIVNYQLMECDGGDGDSDSDSDSDDSSSRIGHDDDSGGGGGGGGGLYLIHMKTCMPFKICFVFSKTNLFAS